MSGFKSYKIRDGVHLPTEKFKENWDSIFGKKSKKPKKETMKKESTKITTTRLNKFFKKSTTEDDKGLIEYLVVNALYEKGENPIPKNHVNYKYLTKSSYSLENVETKDLKDLYKKIITKEG